MDNIQQVQSVHGNTKIREQTWIQMWRLKKSSSEEYENEKIGAASNCARRALSCCNLLHTQKPPYFAPNYTWMKSLNHPAKGKFSFPGQRWVASAAQGMGTALESEQGSPAALKNYNLLNKHVQWYRTFTSTGINGLGQITCFHLVIMI